MTINLQKTRCKNQDDLRKVQNNPDFDRLIYEIARTTQKMKANGLELTTL